MVTQKQRDEFRYAMEDGGVPDVIAFMAAQNFDGCVPLGAVKDWDLHAVLGCGFRWDESPEGFNFWNEIYESLLLGEPNHE